MGYPTTTYIYDISKNACLLTFYKYRPGIAMEYKHTNIAVTTYSRITNRVVPKHTPHDLDTSNDQMVALSVVDSDSPSETREGSSHTEAVMQHDNSYKATSHSFQATAPALEISKKTATRQFSTYR